MNLKKAISKKQILVTLGIFSLIMAGAVVFWVLSSFGAGEYITHSFYVSPDVGGSIKDYSGLINCPSDCSESYPTSFTPVGYQAIPASGYNFVGWRPSYLSSGVTVTSNPFMLSKEKGTSYTAVFKAKEQDAADLTLKKYTSACPLLAGTYIVFGPTPNNNQAVSFYTIGKIVISPSHTATLQAIVGHEVYHIYDWRDNGVINWGENIPPSPKPACFTAAGL